MTVSELDRFRAILTANVAEYDAIAVERFAHQLEEIQAASERAIAVCNLDRHLTQLQNARAALRQIQDSSFGTCHQCDQDIHPKRLAAVPWAGFSVRCHGAADHNFDYEQNQAAGRDVPGRAA